MSNYNSESNEAFINTLTYNNTDYETEFLNVSSISNLTLTVSSSSNCTFGFRWSPDRSYDVIATDSYSLTGGTTLTENHFIKARYCQIFVSGLTPVCSLTVQLLLHLLSGSNQSGPTGWTGSTGWTGPTGATGATGATGQIGVSATPILQSYGIMTNTFNPSTTYVLGTTGGITLINPTTGTTGYNYTQLANGILRYDNALGANSHIVADLDILHTGSTGSSYHTFELRKNGNTGSILQTYNTFTTTNYQHIKMHTSHILEQNDTLSIYCKNGVTGATGTIELIYYNLSSNFINYGAGIAHTIGQYNATTGWSVNGTNYILFGSTVSAHPNITTNFANDSFTTTVSQNYTINYAVVVGTSQDSNTYTMYLEINGIVVETSQVYTTFTFDGSFTTRFIYIGDIIKFKITRTGTNHPLTEGNFYFIS